MKMPPNHHFMLNGIPVEPVSRTYQYRKIMKPMLERKRRARINKCLDELKDLMTGTLQADGENVSKLEKADILELTVRHLHRLRENNALFPSRRNETINMDKFWAGFQHCAAEVSQFLSKYDQNISVDLIKYIANYIPNIAAQAAVAAANVAATPATAAAGATAAATAPMPTSHINLAATMSHQRLQHHQQQQHQQQQHAPPPIQFPLSVNKPKALKYDALDTAAFYANQRKIQQHPMRSTHNPYARNVNSIKIEDGNSDGDSFDGDAAAANGGDGGSVWRPW